MNDIVTQWYENKKNVDEMQNWNSALNLFDNLKIQVVPVGSGALVAPSVSFN